MRDLNKMLRQIHKGIEDDVEVSLHLFGNFGFFYLHITDYAIICSRFKTMNRLLIGKDQFKSTLTRLSIA